MTNDNGLDAHLGLSSDVKDEFLEHITMLSVVWTHYELLHDQGLKMPAEVIQDVIPPTADMMRTAVVILGDCLGMTQAQVQDCVREKTEKLSRVQKAAADEAIAKTRRFDA